MDENTRDLNPLPSISSVSILPQPVRKGDTISAIVKADAPDDGDRVDFRYQWLKNGKEAGENSPVFNDPLLKKGDRVALLITPSDGKVEGDVYAVETITISNSPPEMVSSRIAPDPAHTGEDLNAIGEARDADGDLISLFCRWSKDGKIIEETDCLLQSDRFERGDTIYVEVTPSDGDDEGSPMKSQYLTISNSPPIITSSPVLSLSKNNLYSYQVVAEDPDHDPLTYRLISGNQGMSVSSNGLVLWEIDKEDEETHLIQVSVSDGFDGETLQKYTLKVSFPDWNVAIIIESR